MDENKKARNLSVLSFAVILYVLGGARFKEDGSLFGGSVIFARPWVLEYAGLVLLAFYLYRFLLAFNPLFNVTRVKDQYLKQSSGFSAYIAKVGTKEMKRSLIETGAIAGREFREGSSNFPVRSCWQPDTPNFMTRKIFKRQATVGALSEGSSFQATFEVPLSWWRCLPFELVAALKAILLNHVFWDDIFPLFLCLGAFGLVVAHRFGAL